MQKNTRSQRRGGIALLVSVVLFLVVLALLVSGVLGLAGGADEQGLRSTRQALERAAVLCYATEGFYPPSLDYISTHYGVEVDVARYAVRYEPQGANVMPSIRVSLRGA